MKPVSSPQGMTGQGSIPAKLNDKKEKGDDSDDDYDVPKFKFTKYQSAMD